MPWARAAASYCGDVSDFLPPPTAGAPMPPPVPAPMPPPSPTSVMGRRIAAGFIDLVPVSLLAIGLADRSSNAGFSIELGGAKFVLVGLVALVYYLGSELLTGTSFGKRLVGLRVVGADCRPAGGTAILTRTVFRVVDGLPVMYLLGLVVAVATPDDQRVGDVVAKTRVVADADAVDPAPRAGWHLPLLAGLATAVLAAGIVTTVDAVGRDGLGGFDIETEVRPYATALADGPFTELDAEAVEAEMLPQFTAGVEVAATFSQMRELVGSVDSYTLSDENVVRETRIDQLDEDVDLVEFWFDGRFDRGRGTLLITVVVDEGKLTMLGWNLQCRDCVSS